MRAFIVLVSCLVTLWAGSSTPPAKSKAEHSRPTPKGSPPAISDAELEKTIRAKLAKSKVAKNNFTVKSSGGVVTLEGKTDVIQHKGSATRMARTAGAREVRNKIVVSDAAKKKAAENLESGRRRAQVKRSDPRSEPRKIAPAPK